MPLDKFVLMIVIVIAAAGATVWLAMMAGSLFAAPGIGLASAIPAAVIAYVLWRVIRDRLASREDDHYDHIEK